MKEDLTFSDAEIVALLRFIYPDSTAPPNELRLKDLLRAAGKVGKAPMGAESIEKKVWVMCSCLFHLYRDQTE